MKLWFRLLFYAFTMPLRRRLIAPFGLSRLTFRVWPTDLDANLHMNNGRYLTIMDLGRLDLVVRMGLWSPVLKLGWTPILSTGAIRFRRELRTFEQFALETKIRCWIDSAVVIEHRFRFTQGNRSGAIAATALVKASFYDRKEKDFVPIARVMEVLGISTASPPVTPEITALLAIEDALRTTDRADAGSS